MRFLKAWRDSDAFNLVLVVPAVGYLLAFSAFPLIYNVVMSFQQVDMFDVGTLIRPLRGFGNYVDVFARSEAGTVLWNTVLFVVMSIVFQLSIGFALALFFQLDFPGAKWLRGLFLAGWVMPALVVGAIWRWIFAGDFGVLNYALRSLHLIGGPVFWTSDPSIALWSIIIANVWLGIPFNMILLSVGLAGIPDDVYEAAALDGAGMIERFRSITLPLMAPTLGAVISLGVIFTLQQFDLVAALTQGGPAGASNIAQYWSWQMSFETYEISDGAVVATLMMTVVAAVALIYVRAIRHEQRA
ncbi:sugar ABC transporter permease [Telmatospirillum sp.]|uniref:carbohydrate ABC transporter permease n=1 Tax=Telmatospirillum sp. TaxID=2079197 RepID=UPI0028421669|nr:sugar ABC transporter permease [Telmatospirillum sp.]MDR3441197.1 sugar ABC transporter permease [Telmatospirillum sp.]